MVRMGGMLLFEFDEDGLVEKATGVWDEGVVGAALPEVGGYLFP